MSYTEMKELYKEDKRIYAMTGSIFHLHRLKVLEGAIEDAKRNRHSDCTDLD